MRTKIKTVSIDDYDVKLQFEVADYCDKFVQEVGDKLVVGYLSPDTDAQPYCDQGDGIGRIILFGRDASHADLREAQEALGLDDDWHADYSLVDQNKALDSVLKEFTTEDWFNLKIEFDIYDDRKDLVQALRDSLDGNDYYNAPKFMRGRYHAALGKLWTEGRMAGKVGSPYTLSLDVYEHGMRHISLSGTRNYPDQQWDVARRGGVWIADSIEIDQINSKLGFWDGKIKEAKKCAEGDIELWNSLEQGDVYGVIVETFKRDGEDWEFVEDDACWNYVGSKYAEEELKSTFEAEVKRLSR